MASDLLRLSAQHVWVDYDAEADVLYMSFRRPQRATRTVELDEDTLVRKDGQTVVGVTILNASTRGPGGIVRRAPRTKHRRRTGCVR
ncbi:MAG: hypothetical protein A3K19_32150 [Lentisphaerae bacterium RIFOXYB12_FULL_65_16]|nr:MAG: hypothetical protein A3K18_10930 [Lentisphaerae bacterium RIFOXYA12_64_32]OGV88754.1 MAG: hypothetical protein A3K19_32150 [Lentisphaerae bacterium RIFOXYB12_FULL_65_16]